MKYPIYQIRNNLYHYYSAYKRVVFRSVYGMTIGENTRISRHAKLDKTNPGGVHIGSHSSITTGVSILTHDFVNRRHVDTFIGDFTFVGSNSIILPGISVGNHCIIGAGSVVMSDIPDNSIAAGNPARIIRAGIETKEYGILVSGATVQTPQAVEQQAAIDPNFDILAFVTKELAISDTEILEMPIDRCGVDSFGLITLRTALEARLDTVIPDREWADLGRLSDIAALPALTSNARAAPVAAMPAATSHATQPAVAATDTDHVHNGKARLSYTIDMPQMALSGLSESWLFKEIGDIHWRLITDFLGTESGAIQDAEGDRLYATFTRIRLRTDPSLRAFRENAQLQVASNLKRYGASMFFSDHAVTTPDATANAEVMSTFAKYGERGKNTSLIKGSPELPNPRAIPVETQLPEFGAQYRARRAIENTDPIFEVEYEILPPHDINGVGLLYFAAYPTIFDLGLEQFEGKGFLTKHSTVAKDICYYANSEPDETLILRVHDRSDESGIIRHTLSLSRKSDGKRMAEVISEKRAV